MSLKDRIKEALGQEGKKLTQAGLARACGIKPPSVSDWVSGKTAKLEGENLINAAQYLGVNPSWLASGAGKMIGDGQSGPKDPLTDLPDRLRAVLLTVAGMFRSIPEDQWGNALMDIAESLQKGRRSR